MSFFDRFFSEQREELPENWKTFHAPEQLDEIVDRSFHRPVAIFKHSTRCGISLMAKRQLERDWGQAPHVIELYYLDLLSYRPVSNLVEEKLGILHQSPQVIVVHRGEVRYHSSHQDISVGAMREALDDQRPA